MLGNYTNEFIIANALKVNIFSTKVYGLYIGKHFLEQLNYAAVRKGCYGYIWVLYHERGSHVLIYNLGDTID